MERFPPSSCRTRPHQGCRRKRRCVMSALSPCRLMFYYALSSEPFHGYPKIVHLIDNTKTSFCVCVIDKNEVLLIHGYSMRASENLPIR
ncbi:hypothetical protein K443DRAFT_442058 [Laccaria amethystina LaAM-08-1]|uniref:Uncharacterized protein n=1 Tax=Laccaria amethystina LaAM-08-1 TaxID=1095629 RepID=A0A0C9XQQ3_9AGAR|nr:hypothetical protein K443DRAFT_442058 [Laccaria amethystina LaAM-08-1]